MNNMHLQSQAVLRSLLRHVMVLRMAALSSENPTSSHDAEMNRMRRQLFLRRQPTTQESDAKLNLCSTSVPAAAELSD
jgi:hypothetical protein